MSGSPPSVVRVSTPSTATNPLGADDGVDDVGYDGGGWRSGVRRVGDDCGDGCSGVGRVGNDGVDHRSRFGIAVRQKGERSDSHGDERETGGSHEPTGPRTADGRDDVAIPMRVVPGHEVLVPGRVAWRGVRLRGSSSVDLLGEGLEGARPERLDGARPAIESESNLRLAQVGVVAQHDHGPLAERELGDRVGKPVHATPRRRRCPRGGAACSWRCVRCAASSNWRWSTPVEDRRRAVRSSPSVGTCSRTRPGRCRRPLRCRESSTPPGGTRAAIDLRRSPRTWSMLRRLCVAR